MKFTPEKIQKREDLPENGIFVFGSNLMGNHGKGAARTANLYFGAELRKSIGLTGSSYAIPTKGYVLTSALTVKEIEPYVNDFIKFAKTHPQYEFYVTEIGCGYARHTPEEIAPLFNLALSLENVILPERFYKVLTK